MIERYASLGDFARRAAQVPMGQRFGSGDNDGSMGEQWLGPNSYQSCVAKCIEGDNTHVAAAGALYAQIDSAVEVPMPKWTPSVYGAYACVPEFLAGEPECMRRMSPQLSDTSPLTVMVATDPACGVTDAMMVTRGVAIIALVMKLNQIRPVKLTLLSENVTYVDGSGVHLIAVDINTQPIDLATSCFAIAGASWARRLAFSVCKDGGHHVQWPALHSTDQWIPYLQTIGLLNPQDLFIPAARVEGDGFGSMYANIYSNPVAWVNAQVKRLVNAENL